MQEGTTGIVLRTRPLTETSLIVHWLTADHGRIATVAKGALRPKSPFRGKLDLFHVATITFRRSQRSDLHTLSEAVLHRTFPSFRTDWNRLAQAAYGAALLELSTETGTPIPESYREFLAYLHAIDAAPPQPSTVLALELRHLAELGLLPDFDRESLPPPSRELAACLLRLPWDSIPSLAPHADAVRPLSRFLHGFVIHHLGRLPRGRAEALAPSTPPVRTI